MITYVDIRAMIETIGPKPTPFVDLSDLSIDGINTLKLISDKWTSCRSTSLRPTNILRVGLHHVLHKSLTPRTLY